MSFACGGDGTGKVLVEVDGGAEDCVYYGLTVAQDGRCRGPCRADDRSFVR